MAEYTYKYANLEERAQKIAEAEGLGYMMLHDDFDPDWKPGDEPHGVMTFTDVILPSPPVINWKAEFAAAETIDEKLDVIARRLGLK